MILKDGEDGIYVLFNRLKGGIGNVGMKKGNTKNGMTLPKDWKVL